MTDRTPEDQYRRPPRCAVVVQRLTRGWNIRGLARLLYRLRHLLLGRSVVAVLPGRMPIQLDCDDYFQCMMAWDRYTPEVIRVLERFVRPGDRVVDVGAHVGYISLKLARLVGPGGHVYSADPDPRARRQLVGTLALNPRAPVTVLSQALGDERRTIPFFLSPRLGWSTAVARSHLTDLRPVAVESVPFDDLVADGVIVGPVRFVKIDVEGWEPSVLSGMTDTLSRDRPALLVELNPAMLAARGSTGGDVIAFVQDLGYEVFQVRRASSVWIRRKLGHVTAVQPDGEVDGDVLCVHGEDVRLPGL